MPKPRNLENKSLPERWRLNHGAYYYQIPPGLESSWDGKKMFRLGKTLPEAYRTWADRIGEQDKANTVGQLLDRYTLQVVPAKKPPTRAGNLLAIATLRRVFGDLPLGALLPSTSTNSPIGAASKKPMPSAGPWAAARWRIAKSKF